ncbi:MAG: nitroreductase family protein [Candidatus Buchananbacteria bacterium]
MELLTAIKTRRSIRNFQDLEVKKEIVEKIILAATYAPSACNVQGWKFIVVDDQNLKNKLVDHGGSIIIKNAPLGILILYNNQTKNTEYFDYIQSAAAAIQNLLLAATEQGLATCWICHLPRKKTLQKIFKIPSQFSPVAYILLGYPKLTTTEVPRKHRLTEIVSYNSYNSAWPLEKNNLLLFWLKKILVKIYYLTPLFIKKSLLNKILDKNFVKKFKN